MNTRRPTTTLVLSGIGNARRRFGPSGAILSFQWCQNRARRIIIGSGSPSNQRSAPLPKPISLPPFVWHGKSRAVPKVPCQLDIFLRVERAWGPKQRRELDRFDCAQVRNDQCREFRAALCGMMQRILSAMVQIGSFVQRSELDHAGPKPGWRIELRLAALLKVRAP